MTDYVYEKDGVINIIPFRGSGNVPRRDFYENCLARWDVPGNHYLLYGKRFPMPEGAHKWRFRDTECVPDIGFSSDIPPHIEYGVPFYGKKCVYKELMTQIAPQLFLPTKIAEKHTIFPYLRDYGFPIAIIRGKVMGCAPVVFPRTRAGRAGVNLTYIDGTPFFSPVGTSLAPLLRMMKSKTHLGTITDVSLPGYPALMVQLGIWLNFNPELLTDGLLPRFEFFELNCTRLVRHEGRWVFK